MCSSRAVITVRFWSFKVEKKKGLHMFLRKADGSRILQEFESHYDKNSDCKNRCLKSNSLGPK